MARRWFIVFPTPLAGFLFTLAFLAQASFPHTAEARTRVETGRDLYGFCVLAAEQELTHPTEPRRGKARYCRQYVSGYFASLQILLANARTEKVHTHDEADRIQCARVSGSATFEQLEQKIIRFGEWHPELLDEPAIKLVQKAFASLDPC
ncbi:MAG: Rap1a/Tai family immunity protein [Parvibaculum sp.]